MTTTETTPVLVRWFDEPSADCLRDDGVHRYDTADFAHLSWVFVAASVEDAKQLIEDQLSNDQMLPYDGNDEPVKDVKPEDWRWESDPDASDLLNINRWSLYFRDEYVAYMHVAPMVVEHAKGGPQ